MWLAHVKEAYGDRLNITWRHFSLEQNAYTLKQGADSPSLLLLRHDARVYDPRLRDDLAHLHARVQRREGVLKNHLYLAPQGLHRRFRQGKEITSFEIRCAAGRFQVRLELDKKKSEDSDPCARALRHDRISIIQAADYPTQ